MKKIWCQLSLNINSLESFNYKFFKHSLKIYFCGEKKKIVFLFLATKKMRLRFLLLSLLLIFKTWPNYAIDWNNLTIIQGYPCFPTSVEELLGTQHTAWPRECDNWCSETESCESFTWSRKNNNCKLFKNNLVRECYVTSDHDFWYVKHFVSSRHEFPVSVTLTKANLYGLGTSTEPLVFSCLASSEHLSRPDAEIFCNKAGYVLYSPISLDEIDGMKEYAGIDEDFWTAFKYKNSIAPKHMFASNDHVIFSTDEMFSGDSLSVAGAGQDCLFYDNTGNKLAVGTCGELKKAICVPKYYTDFCDKANFPTYEELIQEGSSATAEKFLSERACNLRSSETVNLDDASQSGYFSPSQTEELKRVAGIAKPERNPSSPFFYSTVDGSGNSVCYAVVSKNDKISKS